MKTFALVRNGIAVEVFPPVLDTEGNEIPISERYHPEFVAQLVEYDPANPPAPKIPAPTADEVRAQRNALLAASDWTQLRDVPDATSMKWVKYRQELRDISKQAGFPDVVEWPVSTA